MSIASEQNILGGGTSLGVDYSFKPYSGTSSRGADFEYTSPTRSYAPDSAIRTVFAQPVGRLKGVDGKAILNGENDTVYGPNADGSMVRNMSSTDSTLLTGIANVIAGQPGFDETFFAKTYFRNRTPHASKSLRNTNNPGANKGGSGVARSLYTFAEPYPDQIQTTSEGGELVPDKPSASDSSPGITNLIPTVPAADPPDPSVQPGGFIPPKTTAEESLEAVEGSAATENSTATINVSSGSPLENGEGVSLDNTSDVVGDTTFSPLEGGGGTHNTASTGFNWEAMMASVKSGGLAKYSP